MAAADDPGVEPLAEWLNPLVFNRFEKLRGGDDPDIPFARDRDQVRPGREWVRLKTAQGERVK